MTGNILAQNSFRLAGLDKRSQSLVGGEYSGAVGGAGAPLRAALVPAQRSGIPADRSVLCAAAALKIGMTTN